MLLARGIKVDLPPTFSLIEIYTNINGKANKVLVKKMGFFSLF